VSGGDVVLVCQAGSRSGVLVDGVRLALERQGTPVAVPEWAASKFGDHRSEEVRRPRRSVVVVSNHAIEPARRDPSLVEIAAWDPRTPAERDELAAVVERIDTALQTADADAELRALLRDGANLNAAIGLPGVDDEDLKRRDALLAPGEPMAVFTSDATDCDTATNLDRAP